MGQVFNREEMFVGRRDRIRASKKDQIQNIMNDERAVWEQMKIAIMAGTPGYPQELRNLMLNTFSNILSANYVGKLQAVNWS